MIVWISLALLLALLLFSVPVAATLTILGLSLGKLFSPFPVYKAIGEISWTASTDFILLSIPLFVLLGEILLRAGIAEKTYLALDRWLSWLPGGLMHANLATAALFAATSGSSVATAATISTVALPQGRRHHYHEGLFAGSIAAGGTLGILIPPSINFIVYGFLTNTSIPQLFMAGIVPGIILTMLFMIIGMYVVLGFFVETLSLMVITIPIVAPVIFGLGFDPVWFGVLVILLIEMALITPPVGLNLYVVQGIRGRGSINEVIAGSTPFVAIITLMIALLVAFPELALMFNRYVN